MIVLASINDKPAHRGEVFCATYKAIQGLPLVDCLRPSHELVHGWKYWNETKEWYTDGYRKLLTVRWPDVKRWLDSLSPELDMTVVCYCRQGDFCHRQLIAQMLAKHRPDITVELH